MEHATFSHLLRAQLFAGLYVACALGASCAMSAEVPDNPCECGAAQVCTDLGCVDTCSPALQTAIAELDDSLTVLQVFCHPPAGGALGAFSRDDDNLQVTHVELGDDGTRSRMTFTRLGADITTGGIEVEQRCDDVLHAAGVDAFRANLTEVAISPEGSRAAWGLQQTEVLGPESQQNITNVFYVMDSRCTLETQPFYRVSSLAFLDEERVLVSGNPEGPVYRGGVFLGQQRIVAESTPGSLWRVGAAMLHGGVLGHGVLPAKYFLLADAERGQELRLGEGYIEADAGTFRFVATEAHGVIWPRNRRDPVTSETLPDGLQARSWTVEDGVLRFGDARPIAGPGFTSAVPVAGSRRLLLRHEEGLVLVE